MPVVSTAASSAVAAALLPANASATMPGDDSLFAALLAGAGQATSATTDTDTSEYATADAMPVVDPSTLPAAPVAAVGARPDFPVAPPGLAASAVSHAQSASNGSARTVLAALQAASQATMQASVPSSQPATANDDGADVSENPPAPSGPANSASAPLVSEFDQDGGGTPVLAPAQTAGTTTPAAKNSAAKSDRDDGKDDIQRAVAQNSEAPVALVALAAPMIVPVAPSLPAPAPSTTGDAISGVGNGEGQPAQMPGAPTAPQTSAAPDSEESGLPAPGDQAALAAQSAQAKRAVKAATPPATGTGKPGSEAPAATAQTQQAKATADQAQNAAGDVIPNPNTLPSPAAGTNAPDTLPANVTVSAPVAAQLSQHAGAAVHVHVEVGTPSATPNLASLAVAISTKSQSGARQFDIRLDPPELGRVDVRLSIDASGKAQAHLSAEHSQTLDLLQKDSGALTRALRDAGLDVSQNGLNFSLKGQDRQAGNGFSGSHGSPARSLIATKTIDAVQSANSYRSSAGDARLDIHV